VFSAAVVLDRTRWISQNDNSCQQVGDLEIFDGGVIRGLRFGLIGFVKRERPWMNVISGATEAFSKGFDTRDTDSLLGFAPKAFTTQGWFRKRANIS
jgi:phosphate-selective porin OprO/OprP